MSSELVATPTHHVTPGMVASAVVGAAAVGMFLTGLGNLLWGEQVDGIVFTAAGVVIAVTALVVLVQQRRRPPLEIRVSTHGIAFGPADALRSWAWADVRALYVVGGAARRLVVEDDDTGAAVRARPGPHARLRAIGQPPPAAPTVSLVGMRPDEFTILTAVREHSGGRFPDAAR